MTKDYLFYVHYVLNGLCIYRCKTNDPYHVIGEIMYRSIEAITRMAFCEYNEIKMKFWIDEGYKIHEWVNKYD